MSYRACQTGRVALGVADDYIVKLYPARAQVHTVAGVVHGVGKVDFQPHVVGVNVALEVYFLKRTEKSAVARGTACDIAGKGFHKWFEERYRHAVGGKVYVEGLGHREYVTVNPRVPSLEACDRCVEIHAFAFVVPVGCNVGIADGAAVVADRVDMQGRAVEPRGPAEQF